MSRIISKTFALRLGVFIALLSVALSPSAFAQLGNTVGGGGNSSTTISLAPGLGNSQTIFNGLGTQQALVTGSTLFAQFVPISKTANYTLNTDCAAALPLCDSARLVLANGGSAITLTAPNPVGALASYQIGDQSGHGYTITTVAGTATFNGCVTGNPTSFTPPASAVTQIFDQGSVANSYYCIISQTSGATGKRTTASPTAPASTSAFAMQGLSSGVSLLTPVVTGNVFVDITGTVIYPGVAAANTGIIYQIAFGTGNGPANAAAATGTVICLQQTYTTPVAPTASADVNEPFSLSCITTGLTLGTAYWFDLQAKSVTTASAVALSNVNVNALEIH